MSFTFRGTYTQNNGDAPAAGTVAIKNRSSGATLDTATLDAGGSYELVLDEQEGEMRVVETITGVPVRTYEVGVSKGSVTDTSRDIGYTGPAQSGASVAPTQVKYTHQATAITADAGDGFEITMDTVEGACPGVTQDAVDGADFTFGPGTYIVTIFAGFTTAAGGFAILDTGAIFDGRNIYPAGVVTLQTTQVLQVTETASLNLYVEVEAAVTDGGGSMTVTQIA